MKNVLWATVVALVLLGCKKDCPTCLNDGVCNEGTCECPEGWTGTTCDQAVRPDAVILEWVKVTNFPLFDALGAPWDIGSAPDVYIVVTDALGRVLAESVPVTTTGGTVQVFGPVEIPLIDENVLVQVYDDDAPFVDELMSEATFEGWVQSRGPVQTLTGTVNGVVYEVRLRYRY